MAESDNNDWRVSRKDEDPLVRSARREMGVVLGFWVVFALWTVLACWWLGYRAPLDPDSMKLVMGMPLWVFWGIVIPWLAATLFTIWFALFFMKDHDLASDDAAEGRSESSASVSDNNGIEEVAGDG